VIAFSPTPILIVSASTNRGELHRTYDALAAGAVDVLDKPKGNAGDTAWADHYIAALKMVARIKVITHLNAKLGLGANRGSTELPLGAKDPQRRRLVAIGASTGGPSAVIHILRALPAGFPLPILLVLHIGQSFAVALADWLDGQSRFEVRCATAGDSLATLRAGLVLMAPPDQHLALQRGRFVLSSGPPLHSCRPSIDVLFQSLAADEGKGTIACLLTGMGRDGAEGLLSLRRAGALTIAQDESTSVIFGMPREAVALGAAEHVLGIDQIPEMLVRLAEGLETAT